jgi:putative transposase
MPWQESDTMDQRLQFVHDALSERFEMTELCIRYDVSRKIGYKWLARFEAEGKAGLANRSRRPHTCPTAIRPALAELLCEFRRLHPDWGARKLLKVLRGRHPEIEDWPAASTAAGLLARRGLVRRRRRRRPHQHPGVVPIATTQPNDLWTADFKGQFRTGNGVYCYPLTIADRHTRAVSPELP